MMRINSKKKGKQGELEFVHKLNDHGYDARRGVQFQGGPDSPDVICHDLPIHFEVKRTKKLRLYDAINQAKEDCPKGKWRAVAHKADGSRHDPKEWLVIMTFDDWIDLIKEWKERSQIP